MKVEQKLEAALKEKFGENPFKRPDIDLIASELKIKTKDKLKIMEKYKKAHGVYSLEPEAAPKKEESTAVIFKRIKERFALLNQIATAAAHGQIRALIVSGPPGLGKTHVVTEAVESHAAYHTFLSGIASPAGLYRTLHETRDAGSVCIIDDCDTIFSDLGSLNILKAACDSTKRRILRWSSDYSFGKDKEHIEKTFEFKGTVIFITNIDFETQLKNPNSKLYPHIKALLSRTHYLPLDIKTQKECLIRIQELIKSLHRQGNFSREEALDVVNFIRENANKLRELSVRTAIKLTQLRATVEDWKTVARITMCKN